jgi:Domain of unknown function (DUF4440)
MALGGAAFATGVAFAPAAAQRAVSPGATATRAVVTYTDLEERLAHLLASGDRASLESFVAEDFALLTPSTDEPLSRTEWFERSRAHSVDAVAVYGLSVLERGGLDLVSCLVRTQSHRDGHRLVRTSYVVDLWRHADGRLLARHESVPQHAPPLPTRPTGRN